MLLDDPPLMHTYARFGGGPFRRSSVFHGLRKFLIEQNIRGRCCFEIGTWNGLTAAVLSSFFDRVVTVDIAHNPLKHEILDFLDIRNVTCIDIADNVEKKKLADDLRFDFAYLDGDHANDTKADFEMSKKCGQVLFHEVWPFQPPVWDLVHSFHHSEVTHGGAGLAIWRATE
jgi:hypothetical protein